MLIDAAIAAALITFGLIGRATGTFRQLAHLSGMALARLIAPPLALLMTLTLARDYAMPPAAARVGLSVLCFDGLYFFAKALAGLFMTAPSLHRRISRVDQAGGFILGAAQGAVLLFLALALVQLFEGTLLRVVGGPVALLDESAVFAFVRRHNPFGAPRMPPGERLERLLRASRDPKLLASQPALKKMLADPDTRAFLQDEALARAVESGDWRRVGKDPRLAALLADPRLRGSFVDPLDYQPPSF